MSITQTNATVPFSTSYLDATGKIPYNMTNDYMFRAILQKSQNVLESLVCALLHLDPSQIQSITITNPIVLGESIDDKEFILDTNVLLNNNTKINLEMQVVNAHNWTDRSLSYLCRSYDQLYQGHGYTEALPAIHIGFLDFQLFQDHAEFYSIYKMLNVKDHHLFSDKLTLGVVDLTCIELATEEDKAYKIDYWARLFKANTWEELKMIAENNEAMQEASQTLYELLANQAVQDKCRAREEYNRTMRTYERDLKIKQQLEIKVADLEAENAEKDIALAESNAKIEHLTALLKQNNISIP